jgi:hypothetical protein
VSSRRVAFALGSLAISRSRFSLMCLSIELGRKTYIRVSFDARIFMIDAVENLILDLIEGRTEGRTHQETMDA